jgi:hypothetical protein
MVNINEAINFIKKHGDDIDRSRMNCILLNQQAPKTIQDRLEGLQNSDGGFSYWTKDFSTVFDTVYVLSWLDDLQLREGKMVEDAFIFLVSNQREDGGWDEVQNPSGVQTNSFLTPGTIDTRVLLTAYCAHWFVRFGRAEPPESKGCPVEFLQSHQSPSGLIMDDLQATWDSLVIFSYHPGKDSELFKKTYEVIEKMISPEKWKGGNIAYLLCCLRDSGLAIDNPFVNLCIDELIQKQQVGGFWESEYGEEYSTSATIEALCVLKHYNVV